MSPVASFVLLSINVLTFILSLSVLVLALWQNPGTPTGRALNTFLACLVFLNATVILRLVNELLFGSMSSIEVIATYLSVDAFALCSLTAFALVITAAGLMKQAFQVIARAGVVYFVLMQWPLWTGQLFTSLRQTGDVLAGYTQAGLVSAAVNLVYVGMGLIMAWLYRRRIGQSALLISITLLLVGQALTLLIAPLRVISFPSLLASIVSSILGYSLVRLELYNPLMMRTAQLSAVRDLSQAMARRQNLQAVLDAVAHQTRVLLNSGIALVLLVDYDDKLIVVAQNGGSKSLIGRKLAAGEGLAGRVLQTQQTMSIANYRAWDGRSPTFADQSFYASLSVPLIDGDDIVGVINVHELEAGRIYNERDRAVIEMLVSQATLGITHTRLHHAVSYWKARAHASDKSVPPPIHFDEHGKIIEAEQVSAPERPVIELSEDGLHPDEQATVAELIAAVLHDSQVAQRTFVLQIDPNLPTLPIRMATLQKVLNGALGEVIERAEANNDVLISARADDAALMLEVARTLHGERIQPFDSVRIRLEIASNASN